MWRGSWGYDADDPRLAAQTAPPVFESEAAYLVRIGLTLPGERRRITPHDLAPYCIAAPS